MSLKKLTLIILVALPALTVGDNKFLVMDAIDETQKASKFLECEDYVDIEYKLLSQSKIPFWSNRFDVLFVNGQKPECSDESIPVSWFAKKIPVNEFTYTKCTPFCNIRLRPVTTDNSLAARITGKQKIFITEKIELLAEANEQVVCMEKDCSIIEDIEWYRHWYTFIKNGKKYFIYEDNVEVFEGD